MGKIRSSLMPLTKSSLLLLLSVLTTLLLSSQCFQAIARHHCRSQHTWAPCFVRIRSVSLRIRPPSRWTTTRLFMSDIDPNKWGSADDPDPEEGDIDWMEVLNQKPSWEQEVSFASIEEEDGSQQEFDASSVEDFVEDDGEAWLDILQGISADEVEFMNLENERADKQRQMQEMGYSKEAIENTLNVAVDASEEIEYDEDEDEGIFERFQEETAQSGFGMYVEDIVDDEDLTEVESHTRVELDEETGEPVRSQMVYVDEASCIGCTFCAGVAQSTFFMEDEQGRARVFQQWGDDDETIEIAIDTCPVNCIHYIPFDELKRLEIERRDQNINNAARLVNTGGATYVTAGYGGATAFSGPQQISGNMGSRCNNCPSRGCKDCPMYGIGKNPAFEERENARLEKKRKKELKAEMEKNNKSADL